MYCFFQSFMYSINKTNLVQYSVFHVPLHYSIKYKKSVISIVIRATSIRLWLLISYNIHLDSIFKSETILEKKIFESSVTLCFYLCQFGNSAAESEPVYMQSLFHVRG